MPIVGWLWRDPRRWFAFVALAIPLTCLLDATLLGGDGAAWILAAAVWLVVLGVLPELSVRRRAALLCFLPLITIAELVLSQGLGWYEYRIGHVPPWVPPAHGIVFVTALRAIDTEAIATRPLAWTAGGAQALYCLVALLLWHDTLGALLGVVFVAGMIVLPAEGKRFYAALGLTVAYLEIVGTAVGTWTWAPELFGVAEMNPPSGAVGGYSLIDGAAFVLAALVLSIAPRLTRRGAPAASSEGRA